MNHRIALIRLAAIAALIGSGIATAHNVDAEEAAAQATIDARAPLSATLLPTVSVDATPATSESNPATMRIADTAPLRVTLLPTVYVTARAQREETAVLLPTVRVTPTSAPDAIADADEAMPELPAIEEAAREPSMVSRARTMPR